MILYGGQSKGIYSLFSCSRLEPGKQWQKNIWACEIYCTQYIYLHRWPLAQSRLRSLIASKSARSYVDMAAICERFTPCHCLLLLPLLDRCELWAFFTTCIHFRSLDMWVSIWDCHNLFLLPLIDRWVSAWELWAFHFLSFSTPSPSNWMVSDCLRIASVLLLVTIYFFTLYLTGECLPENCVSLLVSLFILPLLDWWAFHFL